MKIVVIGGPGQLVFSMMERGPAIGHQVVSVGPPDLDLALPDEGAVYAALKAACPDVVVNAAAHTAVDKAESERDLAFAINAGGAGAVAQAAAKLGVPLIHVSTDYVFDGRLGRPYVEADPTGPTGAYGASKLAGEEVVRAVYNDDSAILRVGWVYSPFGVNFVKTMLRLAGDRDEVSVVADQIGNPTSAFDIADGILNVAANMVADTDPSLRGVFHMTAHGEASWADFAEAIFAASDAHGGPKASVRRITTRDYPTPAKRPANSRLDCRHIAAVHGVALPDWRNSLPVVVARLQAGTN